MSNDESKVSDTEWFLQRLTQKKAAESDALTQAKQEAQSRGKECFDLARLEQLCDLSASFGTRPDDAQLTAKYETKYYVQYPHISTLEEFAKLLRELEIYR